jgi:hypothetical protein
MRRIAGDRIGERHGQILQNLPSLRANGSRECAPDDRLSEAIHKPHGENWIASSLRSSHDDFGRR